MKPGQFITFIMPGIGGRSYSILELKKNIAVLVIKRWALEEGGRWGSIKLCDAEIWETFSYVGPAGHFLLQESIGNKLFLATWTGLVPLYNQIIAGLANNPQEKKFQLVFWVRFLKDLYYLERFKNLKERYPDTFYYHLFVSREEANGIIHQGYVTDYITKHSCSQFEEYYICGAPSMIESCQIKLESFWIETQKIFFEKYN